MDPARKPDKNLANTTPNGRMGRNIYFLHLATVVLPELPEKERREQPEKTEKTVRKRKGKGGKIKNKKSPPTL